MAEPQMPEQMSASPDDYLKAGWHDAGGGTRRDLTGLTAFAVALRLQRAGVPPQELAATLEALRQVLPDTEGPAQERITLALEESLNLVGAMLGQDSTDALDDWLAECAGHVADAADLDPFLAHLEAVTRQYGALAAAATGNPAAPA